MWDKIKIQICSARLVGKMIRCINAARKVTEKNFGADKYCVQQDIIETKLRGGQTYIIRKTNYF